MNEKAQQPTALSVEQFVRLSLVRAMLQAGKPVEATEVDRLVGLVMGKSEKAERVEWTSLLDACIISEVVYSENEMIVGTVRKDNSPLGMTFTPVKGLEKQLVGVCPSTFVKKNNRWFVPGLMMLPWRDPVRTDTTANVTGHTPEKAEDVEWTVEGKKFRLASLKVEGIEIPLTDAPKSSAAKQETVDLGDVVTMPHRSSGGAIRATVDPSSTPEGGLNWRTILDDVTRTVQAAHETITCPDCHGIKLVTSPFLRVPCQCKRCEGTGVLKK